jgi:CheY-like chemotaxis protein
MATILVVDGREQDRQYLVAILTYAGYRILEADEITDALAAVYAGSPNLVIIDAAMSTMDCFEFIRQVREGSTIRGTPILLYTAASGEESTPSFLARFPGMIALPKPAEPTVILQTIARLLKETQADAT